MDERLKSTKNLDEVEELINDTIANAEEIIREGRRDALEDHKHLVDGGKAVVGLYMYSTLISDFEKFKNDTETIMKKLIKDNAEFMKTRLPLMERKI